MNYEFIIHRFGESNRSSRVRDFWELMKQFVTYSIWVGARSVLSITVISG